MSNPNNSIPIHAKILETSKIKMKALLLLLLCTFSHTVKEHQKHDTGHLHLEEETETPKPSIPPSTPNSNDADNEEMSLISDEPEESDCGCHSHSPDSHSHSHDSHSHSQDSHSHSHDSHFHSHSHSHSHHSHSHFSSIQDLNSPFRPYILPLISLITQQGPLASALASSVITTASSVLIFFFIWFIQKFNILTDDLLSSLTSFASGALLGDVFLHLMHSMPQSTNSSLLILAGILAFFVLDRVLSHDHSHKHGHGEKGKDKKGGKKSEEHGESAFLLLLADFLHNVTDGMAIGASYAVSPGLGISTTIAIFLHEIAHEVGDFIAFLKFGVSLPKALMMNLFTGLGSLTGSAISIYYGSTETLSSIVLPIIAGNFLYVSLISMLAPMKRQQKSLIPFEVLFFTLGVGLMVLIEEL